MRQAHARHIFILSYVLLFIFYKLWWQRRKNICLFRAFIGSFSYPVLVCFCLFVSSVSMLPPATCRSTACPSFLFVNCVVVFFCAFATYCSFLFLHWSHSHFSLQQFEHCNIYLFICCRWCCSTIHTKDASIHFKMHTKLMRLTLAHTTAEKLIISMVHFVVKFTKRTSEHKRFAHANVHSKCICFSSLCRL